MTDDEANSFHSPKTHPPSEENFPEEFLQATDTNALIGLEKETLIIQPSSLDLEIVSKSIL